MDAVSGRFDEAAAELADAEADDAAACTPAAVPDSDRQVWVTEELAVAPAPVLVLAPLAPGSALPEALLILAPDPVPPTLTSLRPGFSLDTLRRSSETVTFGFAA